MIIAGFQKLSLIDYPDHLAAVVFTQGCNLRCHYCHNPELVERIPVGRVAPDQVLEYLAAHRRMLEGVCVTGGEPTLQEDLPSFLEQVKPLGFKIKLDTNGTNPSMVGELIRAGLVDYVAMDVKHLWENYAEVTQRGNQAELCRKTFALLQTSGVDHEFRTTVFPREHRRETFASIARQLRSGEKYFIQQVRYQKTLTPLLEHGATPLPVTKIVTDLQREFPSLQIAAR